MTQHVTQAAPRQQTAAGGLAPAPGGIPIPFEAFEPVTVDEIEVTEDELDAANWAPATAATGSTATGSAAADEAALDDLRAPQGRVLVAVGPAVPDEAAVEQLAVRLCLLLAPDGAPTEPLAAHAPADDLAHWARVDAVRAGLVAHLRLLACVHEVFEPVRRQVLVVEADEQHLDALLDAVDALTEPPSTQEPTVLTPAGWASRGPTGVVAATAAQARRRAGRALVFTGQELLEGDLPVQLAVAQSAIDDVRSVCGPFSDTAVLRCHGYARPHYTAGALTLGVGHDDPELVVAVEVRYSRPCCGESH